MGECSIEFVDMIDMNVPAAQASTSVQCFATEQFVLELLMIEMNACSVVFSSPISMMDAC